MVHFLHRLYGVDAAECNDEVSINCIVVCAVRGYISAANLCRSGSRCIHRSLAKLMHFILKCLLFFISHGHLTPVSHKSSKCCPWQVVQ